MGIELNNLYLRDEAQKWVPFKDWDISKIINENASAENEITVGEFFNNASPINNYLPLSGGTLTGDLHLLENSVIKGETPTSSYYGSELQFTDSNDNQIGYVGVLQSTDGEEGLNIGTSRTINGSSKYNSINLKILPNGTKAISFDDLDTKIAWQNALSIPTAASTVKAVATAAVTGTATTYAREDHVHNITGTTITAALGFTPFNSASTLGITHGGTGLTAAPSMLVNLASTATASVFTASPRPGITGTLTVSHGGTGLTAAPSMLVNLGSTATASVFTASPRPGITGTLGIAHGGTGKTTATEAWTNLGGGSIGKLNTVSAANISSVSASVITGTLGVAHGGTGKTDGTPLHAYSLYHYTGTSYGNTTTADITLKNTALGSDAAHKCKMIEIYYRDNDWNKSSTKMVAERGLSSTIDALSTCVLSTTEIVGPEENTGYYYVWIKTKRVTIPTGDTLKIVGTYSSQSQQFYGQSYGEVGLHNTATVNTSNHIGITDVIGYA